MRILWIKTELLHPVDKGGRIRTYQMLRSLARRHEITYLALDDGGAAPDARARTGEYCRQAVLVPFRPPPKGSPGFFLDLLRNLFSPWPYAIARYRSRALRGEILRRCAEADLLVCDFLAPSVNVPPDLPVPTVLFEHNVEAMIWQRHASLPQNPLRRAYLRAQWRRMRRHEGRECRRFDRVIAVSQLDAERIAEDYHVAAVTSVATGVDLEFFGNAGRSPRPAPEVVFVGSMDWMPNDDGIRWFAAEVFGRIRAAIPAARLTVVGRAPSQKMRDLAALDPAIEVTGSVPDVRPYLRRAAVSIVPLRVGGGTRLKIYEAMAMGAPVVSTSIGAEGLPLRDGEHLLLADEPPALAAAVIRLLTDRATAERLADSASRFVAAHCSWDAVADDFLAQCVPVRTRRGVSNEDLVS